MVADGILGVGVALTIAPAYSALMEVARYVCAFSIVICELLFILLCVCVWWHVCAVACVRRDGLYLLLMSIKITMF